MRFLVISIFFLSSINTNISVANENLITKLKNETNFIFIRHALAPGNGDPKNFNLVDCSTQRNLDEQGKKQAKIIGEFFEKNKIKIHKVFSSEWCRCKETAKIAFKNFETKNFLNSFYDQKFRKNRKSQMVELKKFLERSNKNNIVFVTHYVVILDLLDLRSSSGEIIIVDKNLNYLGSINTNN